MIYLLRKHDIISVPSYANGIYHRTIVRYHIEDISPVPSGTDIIVKNLFCLVDKRGFLHGGNNRARTCDPLLVRQVLSQLSYTPIYSDLFSGIILVPVTGLEPVRCCQRGILSPLRLPIPPHRRIYDALILYSVLRVLSSIK